MAIKKIKILGARPIWPNFEVNGLHWQCCLAGSSKRAPRILILSIAMGTDNYFYVKSIATYALTLFGYIISVLVTVECFVIVFKKQAKQAICHRPYLVMHKK